MDQSNWSPTDLNAQPILEQDDETETGVLSALRNIALFRSYRNLPGAVNSYENRISLHSNLPNPVGAASRSQLTNELPPFWFQRSSSVRNLRSNHSTSVINLGEPTLNSTNDLTQLSLATAESYPHLDPHRLGRTQSALRDNARDSQLFSRRLRTGPNRYSMDVDLLLRGLSELNLTSHGLNSRFPSTTTILANSSVTPPINSVVSNSQTIAEQTILLDHQDLWDGSQTAPAATSSVQQTFAPSNITVRDNVMPRSAPVTRPSVRNNVLGCVRAVQTRLPFTPHLRRVLTENICGNNVTPTTGSPTNILDVAGSPRPITFRNNGVVVGTNGLVGPNRRHTSTERSQMMVPRSSGTTTAAVTSGRSAPDRPIHVVRHPAVVVQRAPTSLPRAEMQSSSASMSGASSIEDLQSAALVNPGATLTSTVTTHNSAERMDRQPVTISVDSPTMTVISDQEPGQDHAADHLDEQANDEPDDWRSDSEGCRERWRRLLLDERFADVWFVVGGTTILDSSTNASSQLTSPDPGAPGGPTSMNCYQSERMPQIIREQSASPERRAHSIESTVSNLVCSCTSLNEGLEFNSDADDIGEVSVGKPIETTDEQIYVRPKRTIYLEQNEKSHPVEVLSTQTSHQLEEEKVVTTDLKTIMTKDMLQSVRRQQRYSLSESQASDTYLPSDEQHSQLMNHLVAKQFPDQSTESRLPNESTARFGAHRLVLSTASPVFEAMFFGPAASVNGSMEKNTPDHHIPDISPRAFQIMLLHIYTDEIQLDDDLDTVFYVLYAAKKYMLVQLERKCVEHLKDLITASNVCAMLSRSLFFEEDDLTRRCWHVIDVLAPHVLVSPGLLNMESSNFKALLKRDTLNCKEAEVFAAVRRWTGAECVRLGLRDVLPNRAQVAAEFLHLVRFPTMTLSEFAENVAYSGFLTLETVRDLFVHITTNKFTLKQSKNKRSPIRRKSSRQTAGETTTAGTGARLQHTQHSAQPPHSPSMDGLVENFSFIPRRGPRLWRCSRFSRTGKHSVTSNPSSSHQHSISFQVSNSIFLAGVGIYGSTQIGDRLTIRVELRMSGAKSSEHRGVNSVGTQFHGSAEQAAAAAEVRRTMFPRSSSLLEFTRYDWTGRPQTVGRGPTNQSSENAPTNSPTVIISVPNDPSRGAVSQQQRAEGTTTVPADSNCFSATKAQIVSDGTTRVHDICFPCPVKVVRGQRYTVSVVTTHADRTTSISTSATAMNSATYFVGFFGRPEVRVSCSNEESRDAKLVVKKTSAGRRTNEVRNPQRSTVRSRSSRSRSSRESSGDVIFQFWETAEGRDHGEVDRGFIPELLFYTCS
ncbi:BTB/POZ domain-containing protein 3/6 [Paragonimus westermani]|uniref:BTB/POZ domain-containing protein 3/6 n=1 Tax=Paragonimus westermani TaxID=34504 RepID=A0A5J4NMS9_9TREM|nr:BTB/POZ domain-containing protein 3/6 [Paragonimus westermani]